MAELGAFLLPAAPLLALIVCLLFRRYPGCEAVVRLSAWIAAGLRALRSTASRLWEPPRPRCAAPTGGLLLALSISGRAPPA
ncbi:MAG TPA: hypothetical protein VFX85_13455 [Solirubrobacterales bacterium]|nr:hypothetical protein [Solirubrobacterales bacterium]